MKGSCEKKECMTVSWKHSTLVASFNFLLVHFRISQFSAPVCLSRKEEGRASCVCCVMQERKSAFEQGNTIAKMISRQKQKKHSICAKGNRRIQQAVLADVRVLGEVASLRCVSSSLLGEVAMSCSIFSCVLTWHIRICPHRQHRPSVWCQHKAPCISAAPAIRSSGARSVAAPKRSPCPTHAPFLISLLVQILDSNFEKHIFF